MASQCSSRFLLSFVMVLTSIAGVRLNTECPKTPEVDELSKIPPANMTPLSLNLAFIASIKDNTKFFGGAFFLAVDDLNEQAKEQEIPVEFNWSFHSTSNTEAHTMRVMADLYSEQNTSVFIGPPNYCQSAGLMATAYNIPYMAFSCADGRNNTDQYLSINTKYYFGYTSIYLVEIMRHFGWTSAYLVSGTDFKWQSTVNALRVAMHESELGVNGVEYLVTNNKYYPRQEDKRVTVKPVYADFFAKTKDHTRVYIFLGEIEPLILFVRQLKALVPNPEEYVVLAAEDSGRDHSAKDFYLTKHRERLTEQEEQTFAEAFNNVLILSPPVSTDKRLKKFEDRVYSRNLLSPLNLEEEPPHLGLPRPTVPEEAYYLYDATMMYGKAVMDLMAIPNADPLAAVTIINRIRCRKHLSITGEERFIHKNGRSEGGFVLHGLANKDGVVQNYMWKIANFTHDDSGMKYLHINNVTWLNGVLPPSNPACGFTGQMCLSQQNKATENWIIIGVVSGFLILCVFVGFFLIRKYLEHQENKRMRWKIDENDIVYPSPDQVKEMLTPARSRKRKVSKNFLQSFYLAQNQEPDVIFTGTQDQKAQLLPVVMYKGNRVFEKKLILKDMDLPRSLVSQLKLLKDLSHENLNEFKGACINQQYVRIIAQYCPRRSLKDILEKDDLPLHDMFTTSIVQDLINGMVYIHDSKLGFHGNLKSSNCLVDSRWTVKITDFGLGITKPTKTQNQDEDDVSLWKELLWTAPELLQHRVCASSTMSSDNSRNNSSSDPNLLVSPATRSLLNHSTSNTSSTSAGARGKSIRKDSKNSGLAHGRGGGAVASGTQKGDVYSFAIILYELYGHSGPWGNPAMSPLEIVNGLLNHRPPTPRPDLACVRRAKCDDRVLQLIEACWDDNPDLRPDFRSGIRVRFQPVQQLLLSPNIIDNMLAKMEKYTDDLELMVEERTEELKREKKMTDNLLLRMLPRSVAEKLKRGHPVTPEQYEHVTIYFSDIVGFTEMSADSTPMEVVDLLNNLYTCFDTIIGTFDVYKVETIGDAYMVVSGLPMRNGDRHAGEIASMALQLLDEIKRRQFKIRGQSDITLKIRIGIHSGPCCAGVVGNKMPRYCLFGDTINTASRLESTGEALKVHCSEDCKLILDKLGGYHLEQRGYTPMKGKGSLMTYFLVSEDHIHRQRRISLIQKSDSPWRCVSASNIDYSDRYHQLHGTNPAGRRRQVKGSANLMSYPPLVAAKDINSKGMTRITLPLPSSKSGQPEISSQGPSMEGSFDNSLLVEDEIEGNNSGRFGAQSSDNIPTTPNSAPIFGKEFQFLPCSSSQPVMYRHSSYMSPIAEDPRQPVAGVDVNGVRYSGSDSGSASMESNSSVSQLANPSRNRILSEPPPFVSNSSADCLLSHLSSNTHQNRQSANCPPAQGLNPLNASFDHNRSASEPPDWHFRQESAVPSEPQSPGNLANTSSSFPTIRLQDEPLEADPPLGVDTVPSETDSLLESSWASSNHPFARMDSIPAKSVPDTTYQEAKVSNSNPFASHDLAQAKSCDLRLSYEQGLKNNVYHVDSNCSNSDNTENDHNKLGETIL